MHLVHSDAHSTALANQIFFNGVFEKAIQNVMHTSDLVKKCHFVQTGIQFSFIF